MKFLVLIGIGVCAALVWGGIQWVAEHVTFKSEIVKKDDNS